MHIRCKYRVAAWVAAFVCTVAAVCLLISPVYSYAANNADCLHCHGATQDFSVGGVDRDTACAKCHLPGLAGSHPYHQAGANCGAMCHPGWGDTLRTALPMHYDAAAGASFASASSKDYPPTVLHVIHSKARWAGSVNTSVSACSSCHAPAACDACHTEPLAIRHEEHGATQHGPWSGTVAYGVVGSDQTMRTATNVSNQCATSVCHDLEGIGDLAPRVREDYAHSAGGNPQDPTATNEVIKTGTWKTVSNSARSGARYSLSNVAGSTLGVTFTGSRVELVSDLDPYRGKARVRIDGQPVEVIDLYSPATKLQAIVFTADDLGPGEHTIVVEVLNQKNSSARATYVVVDAFRVYSELPESIAPPCTDCHDSHGDFDHEASQTVGVYPGPAPDYECTTCHSLNMLHEHGRSSSKTSASVCASCHPVYVPLPSTGYDGTCTWSDCHQGANGEAPHNFIDSDHTATDAATAQCRGCHGSDLGLIHDDSAANARAAGAGATPPRAYDGSLRANEWTTGCTTCHSAATFPLTKDCTDAGCHVGSGVVSIETHPAPPHVASGTDAGVERTGGHACSSCHLIVDAVAEHAKTSSRGTGDTYIGCVECHEVAYFPTGWMAGAPATNTCVACHPTAGGKAGAPHPSDEYAFKHDWTATNGIGGSSVNCSGALCHTVASIDLIHTNAWKETVSHPRGSSCLSCHDDPATVPTEGDCLDCHAAHDWITPHAPEATPQLAADNADCLVCHTKFVVPAGNGLIYHDGMCYNCHNKLPTNKLTHYLKDNYEARCTDCHNSTVLGSYDYQPYDPNHYDPYLASHTADYTGLSVPTGGSVVTDKACTSCHANSLKAEHLLTLSSGPMGCFDCHTSSAPIDAKSVIVAGWTDRRCSDCHGTLHNSFDAAQHDLGTSADGLGCSGASCHNGSDIALLHADADSGGGVTSCNVCHTSADVQVVAAGCDSVGCHEGMLPHAHSLNLVDSDYDDVTITGCTNSGAGCHGTDASAEPTYLDYHPNSGCTEGPCHTAANHSNSQFNDPNTCQNCHGGGTLLYDNAPDAVELTEPVPTGHYLASAHDPGAFLGPVKGASDGQTVARCNDCHSRNDPGGMIGLWVQHQGLPDKGDITCAGCHNAFPDVVVSGWASCGTCHNGPAMPDPGDSLYGHAGGVAPAGVNGTGTGCVNTGCHATWDLHVLHKGNGIAPDPACSVCHDYNGQAQKPSVLACGASGCHDVDPHDMTVHDASGMDTGGCIECHENDSVIDQHGGDCTTCHNAGSNLGATNTADCIDCHNGVELGTYAYHPYDPNHYDEWASSHQENQQISGSNWGTTSFGVTVNKYYPDATGVSYEVPCANCHTTDLMTEHVKANDFRLNGYSNECVTCHELRVDNFVNPWAGGCGGEGGSCHSMASGAGGLHRTAGRGWAEKHDASAQVMSQPGSSITWANTVVVDENWGTGTTWPAAWTRSDTTNVSVVTGGRTGSRLRITSNSTTRTTRTVTRTFNTSAYNDGVSFSVWYQTAGLSTATGSNRDWVRIEYSPNNGTNWYVIHEVAGNVGSWTNVRRDLPAATQLVIRLSASFNAASGEFAYFDDVFMEGTTKTTTPLPAGSTALASCQNNPNGTECHIVTDVANIHAGLSNFGCDRCHAGTGAHPTQLNCQASGCHPGVNRDHHAANQHRTSFSSSAVFDANFNSTYCSGCHDDDIDREHQLAAYVSTPCSICHRKAGNSGAPTDVTKANNDATIQKAANTALCTDCHKTVSKSSIHVQRQGWNGAAHTGSPAIGGVQFSDDWSGHRVYTSMPGMKTSFTLAVDGVTATWSRPGTIANMFTSSSGYTATSIVSCGDCHGTVSGATGPHGAAMTLGVDPNYPAPYTSAYITTGNAIASNITGAGLPICAKCHQNTNLFNGTVNGNVHNRSDHKGTTNGLCNNCHVRTPHAWKRPRLIGYMSDPPPYQSQRVLGISTGNKTPTGWSSGGCGVNGCGSHGTVGAWP